MKKLLESMPLFLYNITAIIIFIAVSLFFQNRSEKAKRNVLGFMCIICFLSYIINDYYFYAKGDDLLTLMPLQLCNIAVFLIPLAFFLKKELLFDFVFYICAPGAIAALLIPNSTYLHFRYSLMTISFFIFHFMIGAVPAIAAAWGIYKPFPTVNKALKLSVALFILAGLMHIINLILGAAFHVEANYFFTIIKYSAPLNPAFMLFSRIIPYNYLYLLPSLIVLYIYMAVVFMIINLKQGSKG